MKLLDVVVVGWVDMLYSFIKQPLESRRLPITRTLIERNAKKYIFEGVVVVDLLFDETRMETPFGRFFVGGRIKCISFVIFGKALHNSFWRTVC